MTIAARHQACRYTSTARSATEHGFRVTLLLSHQFRAGFWGVWRDSTRRLEYERQWAGDSCEPRSGARLVAPRPRSRPQWIGLPACVM